MQELQILSNEISHAFLQRAKINFKLKLYKDALADFIKANSFLSGNNSNHSYPELIKRIFGNHQATIEIFNLAVQLDPERPSLRYYLAITYLEMQDFVQAYMNAIFAQQLESDNANYQQLLLEITIKHILVTNKHFFASPSLDELDTPCVDLILMLKEAHKNVARAYLKHAENSFVLGDYQSSLGHLDAALNEFPDNATIHNNRGIINMRLHKYFNAINDLTTAIILMPTQSSFYFNRALAYEKLQRFAEAITDCRVALTFEPNNIEYKNYLIFLTKRCCDNPVPFIAGSSQEHNKSVFFQAAKECATNSNTFPQPNTGVLADLQNEKPTKEASENISKITQ